jgi:predicted nuclease with TOPRIM domain
VTIRDLKLENRDLKEQQLASEKIVEELRQELDTMKRGSVNLGNLRAEHSKLKDDFRHLFSTSERMKHEYKNISETSKALKTENSRLMIQNTELSGEVSARNDHVTSLEIELTKYKQQCEVSFSTIYPLIFSNH